MESLLSGRIFSKADKAVTEGEPSSGFQPLFVPAPPSATVVTPCDPQAEPQIEVVNGKNGIERIIVICTCGKRMELKCEYEG